MRRQGGRWAEERWEKGELAVVAIVFALRIIMAQGKGRARVLHLLHVAVGRVPGRALWTRGLYPLWCLAATALAAGKTGWDEARAISSSSFARLICTAFD